MTREDVEIIILEYIKNNEYKKDFVFSISDIEKLKESVNEIKLNLILHDLIENGYILGLSSRLSSDGNIILNIGSARLSDTGIRHLNNQQK